MTPPAPARPAAASQRTEAMRKGRQADSARRRQRVIATLNRAAADGTEITVAGIARAASVNRAFLYRHRDLLGKIHALEAAPPAPAAPPARPSPAPRCKPTCSPRTNAQSASPPASGSWRNACPKHSASRPGTNPGSAPPPTSTPSTRRSPTSNSKPSTCASSSKNATRTSPRPGPPTGSSWHSSTPRHATTDTPHPVLAPHLSHTLTSIHQPLSCANAKHGLRRSR